MSIVEKLLLGINTTVIGMLVVFLVLIALSIIIAIQSKFVAMFSKGSSSEDGDSNISSSQLSSAAKTGITSGETLLIGVDNDETVALIMAIVSHHTHIPLSQIKFKSIKAI